MSRAEDVQIELLDAYWDTLVGDPGSLSSPGLDPDYARVTARLVDVLSPPEPDTSFVQRLRGRIDAQEEPAHRAHGMGLWSGPRWLQSRAIVMAAILVLALTLVSAGVYAAVNLIPSVPPPASLEDLRVVAQGVDKSSGVAARQAGYGFILENPNDDRVAEGGTYRVTAFDLHGQALAISNGSLPVILPGQRVGIGGLLSLASGQSVDRLHIEVDSGDLMSAEAQLAFSTREVQYDGGLAPKVTGVVINPYQEDVEDVVVSALVFSDEGLVIGGGGVVIDSMTAGEEQTVEVPVTSSERPARVELYAASSRLSPAGKRIESSSD